jgi:hypothetical protein
MIRIFNTVIDESEVVGVGPFMSKRPANVTDYQLYMERTFYFEVYAKQYHFVITTDWLPFTDDHKEESKKVYNEIFQAHKDLRECLISGRFTAISLSE